MPGRGNRWQTRFPAIRAAQGGRRSSMETTLTVKQAAEALGVSPRTLRRRLQAGDLSYTRTPRGGQDVIRLDAAEVARFAQANGYTLRQPGAEGEATRGKQRQPMTTEGKQGQGPMTTRGKV